MDERASRVRHVSPWWLPQRCTVMYRTAPVIAATCTKARQGKVSPSAGINQPRPRPRPRLFFLPAIHILTLLPLLDPASVLLTLPSQHLFFLHTIIPSRLARATFFLPKLYIHLYTQSRWLRLVRTNGVSPTPLHLDACDLFDHYSVCAFALS